MTQNPFASAMNAFKSFNDQWSGCCGGQAGFSEWQNTARKTLEASVESAQAASKGAQEAWQRAIDIAQASTESFLESVKEVASSRDPREAASKQAEAAKRNFEKAASDANEIVAIISRSSNEACEILGKQVSENLKEFSKAAGNAVASAASASVSASSTAANAANKKRAA